MEIEKHSSVDFYRKLLNSAKVFLTEIDERSSIHSEIPQDHPRSISNPPTDLNLTKQLKSTRQECHQRLLTSSRKKLRLLSLQEQVSLSLRLYSKELIFFVFLKNDRRHSTFEKFLNNLDEKRCASIRRYQLELKDYLLQRLQADRLKQQLHLLHYKFILPLLLHFFILLFRIQLLNEEKQQYYHIIDIVKKAIPLFPPGSLQGGSDGVKSLLSRYETLVQTKQSFEQRDFSKEVFFFFSFHFIKLNFSNRNLNENKNYKNYLLNIMFVLHN